jgi:hypothetical protein
MLTNRRKPHLLPLKSRSVKIEVENQKLGKQKREIWNLTIETWKKEA